MTYSTKKGIAAALPNREDFDLLNLSPDAYGMVWHANLPTFDLGRWHPMLWGTLPSKARSWYQKVDKNYSGLAYFLNEPDLWRPDGSDMTPQEAATLYHDLYRENPNYQWIAPNVSMMDPERDFFWLRAFVRELWKHWNEGTKGLFKSWHAVSFHYYKRGYKGEPLPSDYARRIKEVMHEEKLTGDRPVWITEISAHDWPNATRTLLEDCEQSSDVDQYHWFTNRIADPVKAQHSLIDNATGKLTPVGEVFKEF